MLKLKSKAAMLMLPNIISQRTDEQGAFPVFIFGQLQKQWEPTIDQATRWSWIIAAGVMLLFIAYISNMYHSERNTIAFCEIITEVRHQYLYRSLAMWWRLLFRDYYSQNSSLKV